MSSASPRLRRQFLPWDRPLLAQVVAFLTDGWDGAAVLDLSATWVLVPTRQSGRRLREALAAHAAARGRAMFPPRVQSLDALIAGEGDAAEAGEATAVESLLAWADVLLALDLADFRDVFPIDPPQRNFGWAVRLGREFMNLQNVLAEVGLRMADVAGRLGADFPELGRWRALGGLESRQAARLDAAGRRDAQAAKLDRARAAVPPADISRIVVLATPDPRPIALPVLERHAGGVPVDIVVYAPATESAAFDAWGRPDPEAWSRRVQAWTDFAGQVRLCANPEAEAAEVLAACRAYDGDPDGALAVGVVDPEILPPLESALREAGLAAYNPEGRARQGDALHQLLTALAEFARDDSFAILARLVRQPEILGALANLGDGSFDAADFIKKLDGIHARHLPPDFAAVRRHAGDDPALRWLADLRAQLRRGTFPENAAAALTEIFGPRRLRRRDPADAALVESAEAWRDVAREVAQAARMLGGIDDQVAWDLALRLYGESREFADKPAEALELQGWLELVWEDAPHLVVAGLNDGRVPDAIVGDPYLPESLRARLGLKTNAMRLACDAYYLEALAASRQGAGRLDVLFGKRSAEGEPLRPSRLLLRCADAELPARVAALFRDAPAAGADLPWTRAWTLQPPAVALPAHLRVTSLRAWLDCPFRFYLRFVMGMAAMDAAKSEMDALDFGTLCHAALEAMGRDPAMRDATDPAALRAFLMAELDRAAARQFGATLTLPLRVQLESARQRLGAAAEVQAATRAEGWVITEVEKAFTVAIGGFELRGKIDRVDRHEATGEIRVLDYKTSDVAVNPAAAHLRWVRAAEELPAWRTVTVDGRPRAWIDLQLPLYERVVAPQYPGRRIHCAYFNLPKAAGGATLAHWDDYTPELAAAAWTCAEGVVASIRGREFWPPRELSAHEAAYDDFAALFHRGSAASVDWPPRAAGTEAES